jgi:hypothetical protein
MISSNGEGFRFVKTNATEEPGPVRSNVNTKGGNDSPNVVTGGASAFSLKRPEETHRASSSSLRSMHQKRLDILENRDARSSKDGASQQPQGLSLEAVNAVDSPADRRPRRAVSVNNHRPVQRGPIAVNESFNKRMMSMSHNNEANIGINSATSPDKQG